MEKDSRRPAHHPCSLVSYYGLWRHICCPRKKSSGLLGPLQPSTPSPAPAHSALWPSHPDLLAFPGIHPTSCFCALLCAGPAASCISCRSPMVMWENRFHLSRLNSNAISSAKVSELPPAWCNPSSVSTQKTSLVPLLRQVVCLIHSMDIWACIWCF